MTVLDACQSAMMRLIKRKPSSIFSSQDPTDMEVADLVSEVGTFIMKKHEWQALTRIETLTADGEATAYPLPADYDRMSQGSFMLDPNNIFWGYHAAKSVTEWMELVHYRYVYLPPGSWVILNDQLNFWPKPEAGRQATYAYISKNFAVSANGTPKAKFTSDDDTSLISERLLTLGLMWMWRVQKRLDSSSEEDRFFEALDEEATRDPGARVIRLRSRMDYRPFGRAWPWTLGGN